jgi:hypothetical protein
VLKTMIGTKKFVASVMRTRGPWRDGEVLMQTTILLLFALQATCFRSLSVRPGPALLPRSLRLKQRSVINTQTKPGLRSASMSYNDIYRELSSHAVERPWTSLPTVFILLAHSETGSQQICETPLLPASRSRIPALPATRFLSNGKCVMQTAIRRKKAFSTLGMDTRRQHTVTGEEDEQPRVNAQCLYQACVL